MGAAGEHACGVWRQAVADSQAVLDAQEAL